MGAALHSSPRKGKKNRRHRAALMSEINVTPFVDVMLVLLIIFMVTAPLMATGIKVNLPKSDVSQLDNNKNDEPLQISVDKNGNLYIQKTKITISELAPKLRKITKENYNANIFVKGDKNSSYGDVIKAVSAINEAGFS